MSKTTVIKAKYNDYIEVDNIRDDLGAICIDLIDCNGCVFLNKTQTKNLIEHLQSTLEDE